MAAEAATQIDVAQLNIKVQAVVDAAAMQVLEYLKKYDSQLQKAAQIATKAAMQASKLQTQFNKEKLALEKVATQTAKTAREQEKLRREKEKNTQASEKAAKANEKENNSLGKLLGGLASVATVYKAISAGRDLAKTYSDAYEASNLFYVAMEQYSDEAEDFANRLAKAWGLQAREIRESIGQLNLLSKSMGLTDKHAYDLSTNLTQMAIEMSSLRNISVQDAMEKIQAGLAGNSRPLRDMGILVTEAAINETEYARKIRATGRELNQQEKYIARYNAILEAMMNAGDIGDFSRTIDSIEKQTKLLASSLSEIKVLAGSLVGESFKQIMYYMNGAAKAAIAMLEAFQRMKGGATIESETKENYYESDAAWKALYDQAILQGKTTDEAKEFATAQWKASKNAEDTANAMDESEQTLSKMLGKMDKFNVLSGQASEPAKGYDTSYMIQGVGLPEQANLGKIEEIRDAILSWLGVQGEINEETGKFEIKLEKLTPVMQGIKTVASGIGVVIGAIVSMKIGSMVGDLVKGIGSLGNAFTALKSPIALIIAAIAILYATNEDFRKVINEILKIVLSLIGELSKSVMPLFNMIMENLQELISDISKFLMILIDDLKPILEFIITLSIGITKILIKVLQPIIKAITISLKLLLIPIELIFKLLQPLLELLNPVSEVLSSIFDTIDDAMGGILKPLSNILDKIANALERALKAIKELSGEKFKEGWENFKAAFQQSYKQSEKAASKYRVTFSTETPKFAKGGLIYGEVNGATIGEYRGARRNPEVIAPLSDLSGIIAAELEEIITNSNLTANRLGENKEEITVNIPINLDGREISRNQVPIDNKTANRRNRQTLTRRTKK